jgi:hypothetical protein
VTAAKAMPPPEGAALRRRRPWLALGVAIWTVVLLALAYLSVRRDEPTVPEQRDIAAAAEVANRAIGELVAAVSDDAAVEISAPRFTAGCRLTPLRDGATFERSVTVRTRQGATPAVLEQIAHRLPPSFRAKVRTGTAGSAASLRADAGEFVGVRGAVAGPDVLTLTAATGCRPASPDVDPAAELLIGLPIDDEPARVLAALGTTPRDPVDRAGAPCPGRGAAYTARAVGHYVMAVRPGEALGPVAGATVLSDTNDRYVVRDGARSLVVERVEGEVRVAVTDGCGQ